MDQRRFDSLTRSLAAARTRRGLLGSLAAIGAGLLGTRAEAQQVTQAYCGNQSCAGNACACKAGCVSSNGNSRCRSPGTCSPGTDQTCSTTTTTTTTSPPVAGTCAAGRDACDGDPAGDECNNGSVCYCIVSRGGVQVCAQFGRPCGDFQTCSSDGECPAGQYCSTPGYQLLLPDHGDLPGAVRHLRRHLQLPGRVDGRRRAAVRHAGPLSPLAAFRPR